MPFPSSPSGRGYRKLIAAATTVALVAAVAAVPQAPAVGAPQRPPRPATVSATHKVTLVTGDVVTVTTMADGKQTADVDRPEDAVGGVRMQEIKGDLFVIPDEAVALLGADKLDRRLFNVTDLIEMGYDDARSAAVPLIATYHRSKTRGRSRADGPPGQQADPQAEGHPRCGAQRREAAGPHVLDRRGTAANPAPARSATLGAGVAKLWLDGRVEGQPEGERARWSARPRPGRPGTPARASRSRCSTPASTSTTLTSAA